MHLMVMKTEYLLRHVRLTATRTPAKACPVQGLFYDKGEAPATAYQRKHEVVPAQIMPKVKRHGTLRGDCFLLLSHEGMSPHT